MQSKESRPRIRKFSSELIIIQMSVEKDIPSQIEKTEKERKNIQDWQGSESSPSVRKFSSELIVSQISEKFQGETIKALDNSIRK